MDTTKIIKRLDAIISSGTNAAYSKSMESFAQFNVGAQAFLSTVFGEAHIYYREFQSTVQGPDYGFIMQGIGILRAAREDIRGGWFTNIRAIISGEVFEEFVLLAKRTLPENKEVASVLVCAALEDALKRLGIQNKLEVIDNDMAEVINALAAAGILQGPQLSTVRSYTKLRNAAFHAKWGDVDSGTVGSAISFTEEFLKSHFQ